MPSRPDQAEPPPDFDADEIDAEQAAALFDASPVLPVTTEPPTERMRQAARRRARAAAPPVEDPRSLAERLEEAERAPLPTYDPAHVVSAALDSPRTVASFVEHQRTVMRAAFAERGVTIASLQMEMLAVARAAAASGEYQAAGGIYKTVAQTLGAINGDKHLHLHAQAGALATGANGQLPDFRATSDRELYALIERSKEQQTIVDPQAQAPIEEIRSAEPRQ